MGTVFEHMGRRERSATPPLFKEILLTLARSVAKKEPTMITALFVQTNGAYFGVEGIDPWDEARDARLYEGNDPVIAHPPCARWCRLAGMVEKRWGYKKGEDGGCFKSALESVRRCGGVLEHPAYSDAWKAFGLTRPDRKGGWSGPDEFGGYTCHVEQGQYGHRARKGTWLYVVGVSELPQLKWGKSEARAVVSNLSWDNTKNKDYFRGKGERLDRKEASATPSAFKEVLLGLVRSVKK